MCEFVSAVLSNYGGKLRVYVAGDLSSHSEAIDFHGLDHGNKSGHNVATVEWTAPDSMYVVTDEDNSRHKPEWYARWMRRHWATRQDFINDMIMGLLKEGRMVWRMAEFKTDWWGIENTRQYFMGELEALRDHCLKVAAANDTLRYEATMRAKAVSALLQAINEGFAQPVDNSEQELFANGRLSELIKSESGYQDYDLYHFQRNYGFKNIIAVIFAMAAGRATGEVNDMTLSLEDAYPELTVDYYNNIESVRRAMAGRLIAAVQEAQRGANPPA